jgi:DNA-binding LytR/AlgR family response regulator
MKIEIAVCDDSIVELMMEAAMLRRYGDGRNDVATEVTAFSSSGDFIRSLEGDRHYDICVLDMMMPGLNGIDVGRRIRDISMSAVIIYITSSPDYALDAFGVFAEQYLIKPVGARKLYGILDRIYDRLVPAVADVFSVKTQDFVINLRCGDIEYIENAGRFMKVHTSDGRTIESAYMRSAFAEQLLPLLRRSDFLRTHQSFVVNMTHVAAAGANYVVTSSGTRIPVSRRHAPEVKKKFHEYTGGAQ